YHTLPCPACAGCTTTTHVIAEERVCFMVSTASLAAMVFTLLISILFPIVLVIVLYVKKRISLVSVAVGALVFLIFQLLTRIPLLAVLGTQPWYQQMAENI